MLSRNFRLQKVGDIQWLNKHYNFQNIAFYIDELIVLDVSRKVRNLERFCDHLKILGDQCFVPISAGGGIRDANHAKVLLHSGADKIVVNTILHKNPKLLKELVHNYGSQCIVGSVDLKNRDGSLKVWIENGEEEVSVSASEYIESASKQGIGEIYLNSIEKDGTGQGYLMETLDLVGKQSKIPIILAGGAGNYHHLLEGLQQEIVDAAATANLFNFIGNGLPKARQDLLKSSISLAEWNHSKIIKLKNYFKDESVS